jgi:hypothetical protein
MKFSTGDVVRFKIGRDEIQEGEVQIVEENPNEDILYINSFSGWAYKISEKRVVSRLT